MTRTAFCKINLTLEILGTARGDGFHDLATIMHKIPLGDIITINVCDGKGNISLHCDSDVCSPEENLAYKAAQSFLDVYGKTADVDITLVKITPTGAGLGGGSADAACVLDMLQQLLEGVSDDEILEMAKKLGSDVPFCLRRYTSAFCTGRGEICREIDTLPNNISMVVAKPQESINTKGIYGEYDKVYGDDYTKSMSRLMEKALAKGNLSEASNCIVNDFELVCIPRLPEIDNIKKEMTRLGALSSQMSGSGSAVFGIFDDEAAAESCFDMLRNSGLKEVFLLTKDDFEKMYMGE